MTLDEFLNSHKNTVRATDLAQAIGKTSSYVSKLRRFHFIPSIPVILRICEFTNHLVAPHELVDDRNMKSMFKKICILVREKHADLERNLSQN